jgi:hypothetical protein
MEQSKGHPAWSSTPALIVATENGVSVINVRFEWAMAMVTTILLFLI